MSHSSSKSGRSKVGALIGTRSGRSFQSSNSNSNRGGCNSDPHPSSPAWESREYQSTDTRCECECEYALDFPSQSTPGTAGSSVLTRTQQQRQHTVLEHLQPRQTSPSKDTSRRTRSTATSPVPPPTLKNSSTHRCEQSARTIHSGSRPPPRVVGDTGTAQPAGGARHPPRENSSLHPL
jgi:hypothetical protein